MAFKSSPYFNNPQFAQAASNIASMFAPPSGADASGWANAKAKQDEASRISQLFDLAQAEEFNQQQFDRMGVAAGQWSPNQSYYGVDQGNATQRYGIDVGAQTSRANNSADNVRAMTDRGMQEAAAMERLGITDATTQRGQDITAQTSVGNNVRDNQSSAIGALFGPLSQGQIRPDVPSEFMDALGLPEVAAVAGAPKPLSETEVKGEIIQGMDPDLQAAITFGSTPVENIVTPEGARVSTRLDAIGQEPAFNRGAEAATKTANYQTPDGRSGSAYFDPDRQHWVDTASRQPLPEGSRTYTGQLSGGVDETGFGLTNGTLSRVQQQVISLDQTLDTAKTLRDLVQKSPSSQGLVGTLRGTAQDIVQTGGDLGQFFGGRMEEVNQAVRDGLMEAGVAAENFDPNIPAIEMLSNLLSWQYAKTLSGERVSNDQLKQAREALGGTGLFANRANTLTRLDQLIGSWGRQREQLGPMAPGVQLGDPAASGDAAPRVRAYNPQTGRIE